MEAFIVVGLVRLQLCTVSSHSRRTVLITNHTRAINSASRVRTEEFVYSLYTHTRIALNSRESLHPRPDQGSERQTTSWLREGNSLLIVSVRLEWVHVLLIASVRLEWVHDLMIASVQLTLDCECASRVSTRPHDCECATHSWLRVCV